MKKLLAILLFISLTASASPWPAIPQNIGSVVLSPAGTATSVGLQIGADTATGWWSTGAGNISTSSAVSTGALTTLGKQVTTQNDTNAGQACVAITVGSSPFAYTSAFGGDVTVGGGVVTAMTKTRATVVVWNTTLSNDDIPVRAGDVLTVTYTTAPVMYSCAN